MPCWFTDPICRHQWTRPVLGCYCHIIPLWAFWIYFLNSCFLLFIFHIMFKYNWIIRIIFEYSNLFRDLNIFESFLKSWIIFGFGFKNFLTSDSSKKKDSIISVNYIQNYPWSVMWSTFWEGKRRLQVPYPCRKQELALSHSPSHWIRHWQAIWQKCSLIVV